MPPMTNADIASVLDQYGALQGLAGESPFRVRAYHNAASSIRSLDRPVAAIAAEGGKRSIPGVGEGIAGILAELLATGTFRAWEELSAALPPTLLEVLELPGVGAKTVTRLYRELGIADLAALEAAAVSGTLRSAPGFGARLEATVLAGLESVQARSGRMPIGDALPHARALVSAIGAAVPGRVVMAGSVRRFAETAGDLDVVVGSDDAAATLGAIAGLPIVGEVLDRFPDAIRLRLQSGVEADVYVAAPRQFGAVLVRATGPAAA
jgi:DNA polymerase (family 10)